MDKEYSHIEKITQIMIKNFQVDIQDIQTFKVLSLYLELIPIK